MATKLRKEFIKNLLKDIAAFDYLLENNWFENDIVRIGAEQELILVDKDSMKPSLVGPEIKNTYSPQHPWLVGELARFNLELNLTPQVFRHDCLDRMEAELHEYLGHVSRFANEYHADYVLTGILPTLKKYHLALENLTPHPRYYELMSALSKDLKRSGFELRLTGIDELLVRHDSPLLEACNTSFQVHLQVSSEDFVQYYNYALALTAPSIAVSANSPVVFGKRLWHESRIALFQQAIDTRKTYDHMRQMSPRVTFGEGWLENSVSNIFKDDLARFRVLMPSAVEEDALEKIGQGIAPKLQSLQMHNSTVYRWNRPCYGISDNGKPHLRIENRVFPAGPTILDEMANAAFWLGAMRGMPQLYPDIRNYMSFDDIRDNFGKAARYGIDSKFTWSHDKKITTRDLFLEELIPLARHGLQSMSVNPDSIDKYMSVIEERVKRHMNGARWILRSYTRLANECASHDEALTNLTTAIYRNQKKENYPVHQWIEPRLEDLEQYRTADIKVSEFMTTELFTAQRSDLAELVLQLMTWKDISFMPVEDKHGNLKGLVGRDRILEKLNPESSKKSPKANDILVKDVMISNPIVITPDESVTNAIELMNYHSIQCLPVVKGNELVGLVTKKMLETVVNRKK